MLGNFFPASFALTTFLNSFSVGISKSKLAGNIYLCFSTPTYTCGITVDRTFSCLVIVLDVFRPMLWSLGSCLSEVLSDVSRNT